MGFFDRPFNRRPSAAATAATSAGDANEATPLAGRNVVSDDIFRSTASSHHTATAKSEDDELNRAELGMVGAGSNGDQQRKTSFCQFLLEWCTQHALLGICVIGLDMGFWMILFRPEHCIAVTTLFMACMVCGVLGSRFSHRHSVTLRRQVTSSTPQSSVLQCFSDEYGFERMVLGRGQLSDPNQEDGFGLLLLRCRAFFVFCWRLAPLNLFGFFMGASINLYVTVWHPQHTLLPAITVIFFGGLGYFTSLYGTTKLRHFTLGLLLEVDQTVAANRTNRPSDNNGTATTSTVNVGHSEHTQVRNNAVHNGFHHSS